MTNSIPEIRDADFLFVIGSNTTEAHPIIAMEMKRAVGRGAKLAVADPRAIWLTEIADWHMQLKPGSDVWLLNAMAHVILEEGLEHKDFIEASTENFDSVRETVKRYPPEEAEQHTGVPAETIRQVARAYASTPKAGIYYTLGITEHTTGTDNVYALSNLVLMTGHLGVRSAGMNPLRGQNNVQGANDAGATPVFYPGYQNASDPEVRAKFGEAWGVPQNDEPGLNLNQMMKVLGKQLKGLYLMGEDIVVSEPNVGRVEEALNTMELVVVQDIFFNESCRFADVILPAACFAEKDGVFTNSDRRVQRVRKAVEPPGQARADWEILKEVMDRAGLEQPDYSHPAEVYSEMAALAPKFSGISHDRLNADPMGLQWPVTAPDQPSTEYLHKDGVARGKGLFQAVEYRAPFEEADPEFPLVLSTGRTLYHYNAATQTRRSEGLSGKQPECFVEVHRRDARKLGIQDGQRVDVVTRRGRVPSRVLVSKQVRPGAIWMPFHFPDSKTNLLTTDAGDAVTGTGEYKVCAARIEIRSGEDGAEAALEQIFPGSYAAAVKGG